MSDDIKIKIQKLLNLANNAGATEAEGAAAMEAAQRLAMKHGISLFEAATAAKSEHRVHAAMAPVFKMRDETWHAPLRSAMMALYNCRCVTSRYSDGLEIKFFGESSTIDNVKPTYLWLIDQVERLYKENLPPGMSKAERANYRRTFKFACAQRAAFRAQELGKPSAISSSTGTALVVVDTFQREVQQATNALINSIYGGRLRQTTIKAKKAGRGTLDGMRAGNNVKLRREVG